MADDKESHEGDIGVETFAKCNIPYNTSVWCTTRKQLLSVDNRKSSVGLCNIPWHDASIYVTMDEKLAVEQGNNNATWSFGFVISKTLADVFEHFGIRKQVVIKNDGGDFVYWRNFPIPEYETKHPTLGHLHFDEYNHILMIETAEAQEKEREKTDNEGLNTSFMSDSSSGATTIVQHSVTSGVKILFLSTPLTKETIQQHKNWHLTDTSNKYSLAQVTVHSATLISELLAAREDIPESADRSWQSWTFEKFYERLLACFADSTQTNILTKLVTAISNDVEKYALDVLANGTNISSYLTFSTLIESLLDSHGVLNANKTINPALLTPEDNKELANFLFRLIRVDDSSTHNKSSPRLHFKQQLLKTNKTRNNKEQFESLNDFKECLLRTYNDRSNAQCNAGGFGLVAGVFPPAASAVQMLDEANYMQVHGSSSGGVHPLGSQPKSGGKGHHNKGNQPRNQNLNSLTQGKASVPCNGCGWTDICSSPSQCHYKAHPGYNSEATPWAQSTNGRAYKAANIKNKGTTNTGKDKLCFHYHPNGTQLTQSEIQGLIDGGMKSPFTKKTSAGKRQHDKGNKHGGRDRKKKRQ